MAVPDPRTHSRIRFGVFTADLTAAELLKHGTPVKLQERPFHLLVALLEKPGEVVTREELRGRLWPDGTFVDYDHGISSAVNKLRSALDDSARSPRYVETVGRRGYRFLYPISVTAEPPATAAPLARSRHWRLPALVAGGLVGLSIAVGSSLDRLTRTPANDSGTIRSIAVLPLRNLSSDPEQEYFSEGLTDELITQLATLDGLRVISRTSAMQYKESRKTLPEIAKDLNVDAVVDGSVVRAGGRVRITAKLVEAASDRHLWARSYDREDGAILDLQNEVAADIAANIRMTVTSAGPVTRPRARPRHPEAYQAYLQARHRWYTRRSEELVQAVADFHRALAIDPNYALAHAGLADVYLVLPLLTATTQEEAYPKAKDAADRALALDPTLAEAHNSSAYVRMYLNWDFAGAERGFRKAIELNPNYSTAHQWYAELLSFLGRHQEAIAEITTTLELDPLSAVAHHQAGQTYQQARQYQQAIQEYQNAIALDPRFGTASSMFMSLAYRRMGLLEEAAPAMKAAFPREQFAAELGTAARGGDLGEYLRAERKMAAILARPAYYHALYDAALGDDEQAFEWLERAYERRDECLLYLKVDPEWDRLRVDPRFKALMEKVGLS